MSAWVVGSFAVVFTAIAWAINNLRDDVRRLRARVRRLEERGDVEPDEDDLTDEELAALAREALSRRGQSSPPQDQ